jgi:tRNA (guanine-N7-)-methyltransferase
MDPPTPRPPRPYQDAPRLPEGDLVDVRAIVRGSWVEIEVGPGRGGFLFERARAVPDAALVGFEVRRKWAAIVDQRLAKQGLGSRVRVFAEDAKLALRRLGPDRSVRRIFLHFPDPWWKKRHQKRLVLEPSLVTDAVRLLEPGGELFVQTDVAERASQYEALLGAELSLSPLGDVPGSPRLAANPYDARSPREHRAIADGLPVHRLRFLRRP